MPLVPVFLVLVGVGVLLWLVNAYLPNIPVSANDKKKGGRRGMKLFRKGNGRKERETIGACAAETWTCQEQSRAGTQGFHRPLQGEGAYPGDAAQREL